MNRSRWLSILAATLASGGLMARAQLGLPPETNLFSNEIAQKFNEERRMPANGGNAGDKARNVEGYAHVLVFHDGRQICGEVVEITKDEIVWRRPDASEALRFPRSEVRRVILTQSPGRNTFPVRNVTRKGTSGDRSTSAPATVKLPGGDWLFGDLTSADGQTFALKLGAETTCTIARAQIEWLNFGMEPVPAFGFAGNALAIDGWLSRSPSAQMEVKGGTLTVRDAAWIGRTVSPPRRFEIAFEVPEDGEEGLRLWIQPFGPQPNCYGTGTVELRFGRKELSRLIFFQKFDRQNTPLSKESVAEKGPVRYRVLYDGVGRRVVILRNGRQVGDWPFVTQKDDVEQADATRQININGICFDRQEHDGDRHLKFNQLRVQPWDGVTPKSGEAATGGDRLSFGDESFLGKLEALSETELSFNGVQKPRNGGAFVQFENATVPLAAADAMLAFGKQGELSVTGLEIRDGKVHCQTAFAPEFEMPVGTLQTIAFQRRSTATPQPADVLVFKNGDELSGSLLSAALNGPLRWKATNGQEVEIQPGRVAGVRFASAENAKPSGNVATVELRNGERLQGELVALDENQLQWKHAQLGAFTLARGQLWHLYPNPRLDVWDGGRDPFSWLGGTSERAGASEKTQPARPRSWIYLDGNFVLRPGGDDSGFDMDEGDGLQRVVRNECERLEMRCEVTRASAAPPNFCFQISAKGDAGSLSAMCSYGNLQLVVNNPKSPNRQNWRNISLRNKLNEATSRVEMRIFVDRKVGTADVLVDGVLAVRIGQDANDRLPGLGERVRFRSYSRDEVPLVFSNLWVGPWNGELPRSGEDRPAATALANGDVASGAPKALHEGKFLIESEIGSLELAPVKVQAVDFGGTLLSEKSAARIRLADGCAINVDTFRWDGRELVAHSPTLGDLRLPAGAVSELIYDPALSRAPLNPEPKNLAQKPAAPVAAEVAE